MKIKSFKTVNYYFQHIELVNTNLTKFEWTKTELKRVFYKQNSFGGKRILNQPTDFTFSKTENAFRECALDCGF